MGKSAGGTAEIKAESERQKAGSPAEENVCWRVDFAIISPLYWRAKVTNYAIEMEGKKPQKCWFYHICESFAFKTVSFVYIDIKKFRNCVGKLVFLLQIYYNVDKSGAEWLQVVNKWLKLCFVTNKVSPKDLLNKIIERWFYSRESGVGYERIAEGNSRIEAIE